LCRQLKGGGMEISMIIFFDFFFILLMFLVITALGVGIIQHLKDIVLFIVLAIVVIAVIIIYYIILKKLLPKYGGLIWITTTLMALGSIAVLNTAAYYSYRVYQTKQDIVVAENEERYYYWTEEDIAMTKDDRQKHFGIINWNVVIPAGTELIDIDPQFNFEYSFRLKPDGNGTFLYNGKKVTIPYNELYIIGEKPIWGKIEYLPESSVE